MAKFENRDPIHGRIPFSDFEKTVIDHPFFQRLRQIKQLALVSLVYPGAEHTRFSHSIGVMHVAGRIFGRLCSDTLISSIFAPTELNSISRRVRMAGLLHDIGHGPFSHTLEVLFPMLCELDFNRTWWKKINDRRSGHEDYSVLLIQALSEEGVLEPSFAQDVASLIHKDVLPSEAFADLLSRQVGLHKVLKSIISGELDADRMDYLLRDSYFCGVSYGKFDLDWIISSLNLVEINESLSLALSQNSVRAFEDMLLARYHMIDQVYLHKTQNCFVHYLLQSVRKKEIPFCIPVDPYEYADLRDAKIIEDLFNASKNDRNYWSHHLIKRIPAKRILRLHDCDLDDKTDLETLINICEMQDIQYFTYSASASLSEFGESGEVGSLYVAKQRISSIEYVPIWKYSDLLQKYNEKIHFVDFFVSNEDYARFLSLRK